MTERETPIPSRSRRRIPAIVGLSLSLVWVGACSLTGRALWIDAAPSEGQPVVDRLDDTTLRVRWPAAYTLAPVSVFAGDSPDTIDRDAPVARSLGLTRSVTIRGLDPAARTYFEVVPHSATPARVVAERRLPLDGTNNFRDLGGYDAEDGRTVRWGLFYRSTDLAALSDRDLDYLAGLGIRLVCDFRSEPERTRAPDRTPATNPPDVAELSIDVLGVDPEAMQERIRTGRIAGPQMERVMQNAYRAFVFDFTERYAAMFERISRPSQLPTILHCTGGKDRAGFASALVLLTLGVSKEDVFEDYLRTNLYRANYNKWIKRLVPVYSLFRTEGEDLAPLLEARRSYLAASLDAIDERYGSIDGYLEQGLGIDPGLRERMQALFLEQRHEQAGLFETDLFETEGLGVAEPAGARL
jgi:protein-tyrosine phosphatase